MPTAEFPEGCPCVTFIPYLPPLSSLQSIIFNILHSTVPFVIAFIAVSNFARLSYLD